VRAILLPMKTTLTIAALCCVTILAVVIDLLHHTTVAHAQTAKVFVQRVPTNGLTVIQGSRVVGFSCVDSDNGPNAAGHCYVASE